MAKIAPFIFALLLLLVSAGTAAAFSDSVERYETDYTDYWTYSYTEHEYEGHCEGYCEVYADPRGFQNNAIRLRANAYSTSSSAGDDYCTATIKSNYAFDHTYIAFTLIDGPADYDVGTTNGGMTIKLYCANTDQQTASIFLTDTEDNTKYELIRVSDSYVYLYANGVKVGECALTYPGYTGQVFLSVSVKSRIYHDSGGRYVTVYLDDFTDESIIGTTEAWHESSDNITLTWSEQLLRSYPTAEHEITLYSITGAEVGEVTSWTLPDDNAGGGDEWGYIYFNRSTTLEDNYGLYMLEMTRGSIILTDTYFTYSQLANPTQYPDVLLLAGADVAADIRDDDNNGGEISAGGEVYLYPTPADTAAYNISYEIEELPYSFEAQIEKIYATSLNSTTIEFSGLAGQNYLIEIDGESISGTKATGTLTISGNVTDTETVSIGSDVYEFNNTGGTTGDNIPVSIGVNLTTSAENLTTAINNNGTAAVSANCTVSDIDIPDGFTYIAECTISDPSDQEGYQTAFNISQQSGMQADGEDIRFMAENGTNLSYWIDYSSSTNNSYYTGYVATPADATKIYLYFGNVGAPDASDGQSVFDEFFDSTSTTGWTSSGVTVSTYDGYLRFYNPTDSTLGTAQRYDLDLPTKYVMEMQAEQVSLGDRDQFAFFLCDGSSSNRKTAVFIPLRDSQATWEYDESSSWKTGGSYTEGEYIYRAIVDDSDTSTGSNYYLFDTTWTLLNSQENKAVASGTVTDTDGIFLGDSTSSGYCDVRVSYIRFRKYEATDPALSVGTPTDGASAGATISLIATDYGTIANSITTTDTLTNGSFASATLAGGTAGSQTGGADTWDHTLTDWTDYSSHTFAFSPDPTLPGVWGYITDSSTQERLPSATVTIANSTDTLYLYADSNGMYYKTAGMTIGSYNVTVSKGGYTTSIPTGVTTQAGATTRQDFYLDQEGGAGVYYAPHDVIFTVWEYWYSGAGLPGVTYHVYNNESTLIKSGTTDSNGAFTVEDMDTGTRYTFVFTHNENTYTEYIEPGLSEYTIILNKENIIHEYYNNWLNITYTESPGAVNISYISTESILSATLTATAANGTTVYSQTSETDTGQYNFTFSDGDYRLQFTAVTDSGLTASQSWAVSQKSAVELFPTSYPAWLKNLIYVFITLLFLLAFGKARNDVACLSAAFLVHAGYYFEWLSCTKNFAVMVWIIAILSTLIHYKRTKGTG